MHNQLGIEVYKAKVADMWKWRITHNGVVISTSTNDGKFSSFATDRSAFDDAREHMLNLFLEG